MPYTHIPLPLWARAIVGGAVAFATAAAVVVVVTWNPGPDSMPALPEAILVAFFALLGFVLVAYGLRVRRRDFVAKTR